ncbi:cation:proton antiporter [Streptomyces chartreusis]|uniref:cation:proton antiporter n=1 Tax=Streptomyces chartreusis TaxID=1969 RepID=UPI00371CA220
MPGTRHDNLVIVLAVAAGVPFLLALVPRARLPGPVLEIVAGIVLGSAVLDLVQPDETVEALSIIGLSFLLFLAGLEIDVRRWQGPLARLVATGLAGTVVLAVLVGWALNVAGVVESPLLVGVALVATSLGLLVTILKDADAVDRLVGQLIGGTSAGELLLLLGLACLTVLVVVTSMRAGSVPCGCLGPWSGWRTPVPRSGSA